jgi:TPR repeat protein
VWLALVCSQPSFAQEKKEHPESPVFKDKKTQSPSMHVEPSDITYQLWQAFQLTRKAHAGDILAQHELGIRYLLGKGLQADTARGAYWIQRAAAQGLGSARFNLGILYYHGWGVPWNPFEAYKNFLSCAQQGMVDAQFVMGQFLSDNLVVPRNFNEAYTWVKKAADAGYEPAKKSLKELEKRASQYTDSARTAATDSSSFQLVLLGFDEDSTKVDEALLLRSAFQSGGEEMRRALGITKMLETGAVDSVGVEDIQHAAEAGSPEALTLLGRCYERGISVGKDIVMASLYYVRATRLNSPRAPELLWTLVQSNGFAAQLKSRVARGEADAEFVWSSLFALGYDLGLVAAGVPRLTDQQALKLLEKAALREHRPSLIELGSCYYVGRWVRADLTKAQEMWKQAATLGSDEARVRLAIANVRQENPVTNYDEAIRILSAAVDSGSVLAEVGLAYCYETGRGVPVHFSNAAKLYRAAAQRGSQDGYRALRRMHDEIRPEGEEFRIRE